MRHAEGAAQQALLSGDGALADNRGRVVVGDEAVEMQDAGMEPARADDKVLKTGGERAESLGAEGLGSREADAGLLLKRLRGVISPSDTARCTSSQEAICISRVVRRMLSLA